MQDFNPNNLKTLYIPKGSSHKGENGKLMIIAGSVLFHAASLWPLTVASRIVDMVYFSSVSSNNEIVQKDKESFRNGIVIPRKDLEKYVQEADCILIGSGLPRDNGHENLDDNTKELTEKLLLKYPTKRWVVDGGSLQMIDSKILPKNAIVTPNKKEFEILFNCSAEYKNVIETAQKFQIVIILKGEIDYVSDGTNLIQIKGGNGGMTKGGTGDVLAGLVASFYCKNDAFLSSSCASYINKKASDALYEKMGLYYNASDLANEIPIIMKKLIL